MYTSQTRSTRWVYPVPKTRGMNTTFSYSAKVFDSPFGEICTTPPRTVTSTCRVFSWQLNLHESRGIQLDLTPLFQFHRWRQCWRIFLIFVLETFPDISFSENQTRGSCLGCRPYTWGTVWNFKQGQIEGQEHASECLAMPSFQGTGKTSYEMMTIRMNSSGSSEKSALPWTHETRSSYPPYCTVSLALEMVRIQTDFKHAHTKRLTPRCLYMSKTPSRWW